jgi:acetylornithine/succinyldiaminopimelate/putrescine aminotransferase
MNRQIFLHLLAQTSDSPLALEIEKADGIYLYGVDGKRYIDLISGVSVSNLGHGHPRVIEAIKTQLDKYMHLMVYGEYIQSPQTKFAQLLTSILPDNLNNVYFVNSGSEAVEGAMKLAKRFTGRSGIVAFKNSYHGSTQGALSLMSDRYYTDAFRPLLPDITYLTYNNENELSQITTNTACVVAEIIQAEAGIIEGTQEFLKSLRARCTEVGALLIVDEIQTGLGRTGTMFAFQAVDVIPDILLLAKAFGGGLPLGAFISDKTIMDSLKTNPILGHISTFGGHPVCCTAGLASLKVLLDDKIVDEVNRKGEIFKKNLQHPNILSIRGKGLFLAVELKSFQSVQDTLKNCIENGLVFDWFLFENRYFRIAPPLIITDEQIIEACVIIKNSIA